MSEDLRLSDAIKKLRAELEAAQTEGDAKAVRFLAKTVEIELSLVLKTETTGEVGVKAWFVNVSGSAASRDEATTRMKLVLEPVDRDGKPALVRDNQLERDR